MNETIAVIPKNSLQEFRIEIVTQAPAAPMIKLRLYERHGAGEMRPRPGTPGIPPKLALDVVSAIKAAANKLGVGEVL